MATIRKRGDSYQIRVSVGYEMRGNHKEQAMTWKPTDELTERQVKKELNRLAVTFEENCLCGFRTSAIKFEDLAEEWFAEYAELNLRHTTLITMRKLTKRVYPALGHLKMDKISLRQIQAFINSLAKDGTNLATGKTLAPKTTRHYPRNLHRHDQNAAFAENSKNFTLYNGHFAGTESRAGRGRAAVWK